MVVITCRIGKDAVEHRLVHLALNLVEISTLVEFLLLGISQSVETHILQGSAATGGSKGIGHGALGRNLTPLGIGVALAAIYRHATLIEFLAITQDILAHLAQVDVEIATVIGSISLFARIDERIEHPELDVFDVCLLEIVGIQFTHHSAPVALRILQSSVCLQICYIEVVWSRLTWIVSQIEYIQGIGSALITALVSQWEELLGIDLADIMVTQLLEVALDMSRSERTSTAGEQRIDGIPG